MTLRRRAAFLGLLLVALLLAACAGGSDGANTTTIDVTTPSTTAGGTGATSATVAPDAAGVALEVFFLEGGKVATGHRRVAPTQAVARAALEQLIAGPNGAEVDAGFTTVIRPGSTVSRLDVTDGVATVTLSPDLDEYPADTTTRARAQVVYALTQFKGVEAVRFGQDGTPVGRADYRTVTPLVLLESVAPGDTVTSPVTVAGEANTFEATVRIRVLGADGAVLADTFTTATSGSGTWGDFSERVSFDRAGNTTGKVVVFWDSPKDGSPQDLTEVPVRFS